MPFRHKSAIVDAETVVVRAVLLFSATILHPVLLGNNSQCPQIHIGIHKQIPNFGGRRHFQATEICKGPS